MKTIWLIPVSSSVVIASFATITAARFESTTRPNCRVGNIEVGKMLPDQAAKRLRIWWETAKLEPAKIHSANIKGTPPLVTLGDMGVSIDDKATIAQVPVVSLPEAAEQKISGNPYPALQFPLVYKVTSQMPTQLVGWVRQSVAHVSPATITYQKGTIFRRPESSAIELNLPRLFAAVQEALKTNAPIELPIREGAKRISDASLATITDVVASYSTRFPLSKVTRNANIKLASHKLNGVILLPGERLSFNGIVGQRTKKAGFQLAGVYKQGKHDVGIGGGICQVSTTLYNACLLANLQIKQRSNHSMPVAYVPLGRDATVDYGSLDLIVENSTKGPIAVNSEYKPGRLTFRILGKREPGLVVKIVAGKPRAWERGSRIVADPTLKPGQHKVVDKGSRGHEVVTTRLVIKNGVVIKRERLGRSYYTGGEKIIAVAPSAVPVVVRPVGG